MDTLERFVSSLYGCTLEELFGSSRKQRVVNARKICMLAMRKFTNSSLSEIGAYFNRDHATALQQIRKAEIHYETERDFKTLTDVVFEKCHNNELELPFQFVPDMPRCDLIEEERLIIQLT
jgi:chromosomal replication initiation ATPase DnaA